jgi:hypothetical protein
MPRPFHRVPAKLASKLATVGAGLLLLAACGATPGPTAPNAGDPSLTIADAAFGLGDNRFYWLPPTVAATPAISGTFAKKLSPTVTICEWDGTACGATVAHFTRTKGTGGQVIAENTKYASYRVSWISSYCDTRSLCPISSGKQYRMIVTLPAAGGGTTELGYADIKVVNTLIEQIQVDRTQYVPLMPGRLLGIAFWIGR